MGRWRMDSLESEELWARRQGGATYAALGDVFGVTREAIFAVVRARLHVKDTQCSVIPSL